ncbi:hypothetical protein L6164_019625 [Bauhinia variegata]|uniref:Uncharacterized protein n=1 Tax=Bauhinia variegata TaxID=167791 RepID=A0ACB9MST5_BAUVA|nr:hypothetical protein L6164_019625 [Bauhinia variegata]
MASNPPFQVEDTDEYFFDKLVEDNVEPVKSGDDEGNDSDDAKAFANLGISDADAAFENSDGGESGIEVKEGMGSEKFHAGLVGPHAEEGNSLVSSSVGCDNCSKDPGNGGMGSEFTSASSAGNSNGIINSEVKEVGWNSFYADSNGGVGFGSYSDFFNELGNQSGDFPGKAGDDFNREVKSNTKIQGDSVNASVNYVQYVEDQNYDSSLEKSTNEQDLSSTQYWESQGWRYDPNTGQWYLIDGYNGTAAIQESSEANSTVDWNAASDGKCKFSYMQQSTQSVAGTLAETGTTESVSNWSQVAQGNNGYPEHMYFDPQYPEWYYDKIALEWRLLSTYNSSNQSSVPGLENGYASTNTFSHADASFHRDYAQAGSYDSQGVGGQATESSWDGSYGSSQQQGLDRYTTAAVNQSEDSMTSVGNQQFSNSYASSIPFSNDHQNTSNSFGVPFYNKASQSPGLANGTTELQGFVAGGDIGLRFNYSNAKLDEPKQFSNDYPGSQKSVSYSQQSFQGANQFSYGTHVGRSSAGRPPHALVTFGFGGKLIIMKDSSLLSSSYGSQDTLQSSVSVLNLMEVVGNVESSRVGNGTSDYFSALCQQSFPGPLVGGSVGSKELYKWIDERIAHCGSPDMDIKKGERLRLLLSLLKIACQHYGKLRSPFGTDTILKENDSPESAVAKLFASAKMSGTHAQYGVLSHCLQNLPSEGQTRATASEVQHLLVSGKKKEALQCAQEGQLWGPALVIALQLGDQFYVDTVKQMALRQLVAGSPLRTLCLLIAGQPAEVFSTDSSFSGQPAIVNMPQQPAQCGTNGMLDDWEENLAVITANRTKDDELVIIHLGDCLWKERSEIIAAHICYLVAEANFESYSDSARLCLIGADHWKFPRTFASPEAIQRTELYEYSKVLGNSQFILLPFQPYKLIYAYMLAEVGRVLDSLKYCQAVLKSLKTGRAPEVETWKQLVSSLEERIKTHQQGGYTANLAPGKLVGKLLNLIDSTAHRVVGGLPPPAPSTSHGNIYGKEHYQPLPPRVPNSQSTMAMSSLVPSASMEPISEWTADGNRMTVHNRSVSEPDFGRTPRQVDSSQETTSSDAQGKASVSGGSRFSRFSFGSQLFQKTVELVLRPRPGRQAKLGEKNKFYYDEKLKRWVEEGAEPPAEEAAIAPPPTAAAFQSGKTEYNLKSALKTESSPSNEDPDFKTSSPPEHNSGIPPMLPSSNQFSARGRMGHIRSRYVDTFNQGGGSSANLFQSPSVPSVKPAVAANAKFFIPAPVPSSNEQTMEAIAENTQEGNAANEDPSMSAFQYRESTPMQRFPSMGNIASMGAMTNGKDSLSPRSRRTASWSGSFGDAFSPPKMDGTKPLGEALGMPPSTFMPEGSSLTRTPMSSGNFGDLQEVEL